MKSSKFFSTEELRSTFGAQLETSQVVVVAHHSSSEDGCVRVEFAQMRTIGSSNRPAMSKLMKDFARRSPAVVRAWLTVDAACTEEFGIGECIEDMHLHIVDQLVAPYDDAVPRLSSQGTVLADPQGRPIYRTVVPAYTDEGYADHMIPASDTGEEWSADAE